jgi:hypothetical protein
MVAASADTIRTILQRTPPDEDPNDVMVMVGTLTLAYLAYPRWRLHDATDFEQLTQMAGKIWCLLTDVTKTHAYSDGMRIARRSYRGVSREMFLQRQLQERLHRLIEEGELQTVRQAVDHQIYLSIAAGHAF